MPLPLQVLACPLDWHEDVPGLSADVIVGSDICYDPEAVPSLVRLLAQLLDNSAAAGAGAAGARDGEQSPPHTPRQQECSSSCTNDAPSRPQCQAAVPQQQQEQQQKQQLEVAGEAPATVLDVLDSQPVATSTAPVPAVVAPRAAPVAYISTTKRQGSTLQLFLDLCEAAGLSVQELPKDPAVWARGCWGSCNGSSQCVGGGQGVAVAGCCSGDGEGGCVGDGGAVFQEVHALQQGEGRERYALHRVVKRV